MFQQLLTQEVESGWRVEFSYDKKEDRYNVKMTNYRLTNVEILYGQGSNNERALLDALTKRGK